MSDFEVHPIGTGEELKRLREQVRMATNIINAFDRGEHWEECDYHLDQKDGSCSCMHVAISNYLEHVDGRI